MQRHTLAPLEPDPHVPKLDDLRRILDYASGTQGDIIIRNDQIGKTEMKKSNRETKIIE